MKKVKVWYANKLYNKKRLSVKYDVVRSEIIEIPKNIELWKINRIVQLRTLENDSELGIWNYLSNNPSIHTTNFISGGYDDNPFRLKVIKGLTTVEEVGKLNKTLKNNLYFTGELIF